MSYVKGVLKDSLSWMDKTKKPLNRLEIWEKKGICTCMTTRMIRKKNEACWEKCIMCSVKNDGKRFFDTCYIVRCGIFR